MSKKQTNLDKQLATRLLEIRTRKKISQASLAERMTKIGPTKVAQSEISDLECGKTTIGMRRLAKLAKALETPINTFFN